MDAFLIIGTDIPGDKVGNSRIQQKDALYIVDVPVAWQDIALAVAC